MGDRKEIAVNILALHDSSGMYGAERVILNLGFAIKKTKYKMIVGCLTNSNNSKPELGKEAERVGLDVEYFPMKIRFDPLVIRSIGNAIRKLNIRLIHAHGYKSNLIGLIAARMHHIPIITTNHLFPPMPLNDRKLQLYSKLDVLLSMRRLNLIIAVSEDIRKRLAAKGVQESRIIVIENGIDLDAYRIDGSFDRSEYKKSLGITDGTAFIVGTLGRLTPQKAHTVFLEAAKKIKTNGFQVVFLIAGDGFLREELKEYARVLGISESVKFLGFRADIKELLNVIDIFVLSSIDEGLPMAMLEAMASRRAVVATRVGDIPKVIKGGENGILVEPGNSDALANKIIFLLTNSTIRDDLAVRGFRTVQDHYSKEAMGNKYLKIYDALIARSKQ